MKNQGLLVLVESDDGKISSDYVFCGWYGAIKNAWFDKDGYDVRITTIDGLSILININKYRRILPIGSVEFMKRAADIYGMTLPDPINVPESLKVISGRKTWTCTKNEIKFPSFIKPLIDVKIFTGFVIKSTKDFILYPELKDYKGDFFCSEVIEDIQSEWRCFVLNGKILNCSNYNGDPLIFPDKFKIQGLLEAYYDAPAGYSLDVCVTPDGTKLVEINDGWALGNYGCNSQDYFAILKARWFELIKQHEENNVNIDAIL